MAEEVNKNVHLLTNLISAINEIDNEDRLREFLKNMELSNYPSTGQYAQCIYDIKQCANAVFPDKSFKIAIIDICSYYLDYAKKHDPIKKHTDSRKEKYRQLNLDMPKDLMDKFDNCLKENKQTKKEVITKAINDYISKKKKN